MENLSMFKINTSSRTTESEIMDDFDLRGSELRQTLKDLENINSLLGGNNITKDGIKKLLADVPHDRTIRIADLGCGNGAMLRSLANWGQNNEYSFQFVGIDANPHAIRIAEDLSMNYPQISFLNLNIFSDTFSNMKFDIILCTLTLHHFKDEQINNLLRQFYKQVGIGIVINDLHRSKMAYFLFKAFCSVFVNNEIARKDGLISILRGFKKEEIHEFSSKTLPACRHHIQWKWAFRYQWVIQK